MLIFSPKLPDQIFEIAILFSMVEKYNNYVFEDDLMLPQVCRGRAESYGFLPNVYV